MEKIPLILVTFNPPASLAERLDQFSRDFDQIILVDNGSSAEKIGIIKERIQPEGGRIRAILNSRNIGVAAALNQGFSLAHRLGYRHAIALDQDSIPAPDMLAALTASHHNHPNREKLAVLAPDIVEKAGVRQSHYITANGRYFFRRVSCEGTVIRNVSFAITSGSMFDLELYKQIGPFREDFFIDAVDMEYCLRAITKGCEVSIACNAKLEHQLGNRRTKKVLGRSFSPTFHPPSRWYYINRNRVAMIIRYGWRFPHWLFHELGVSITSFARMLLLEDKRIGKTRAVFFGLRDGLLQRMGEMPDDVKKVLVPQGEA